MRNGGEKLGVMRNGGEAGSDEECREMRGSMRNRGSEDEWRREAGSDEQWRETWGAMRNRGSDDE